MFTQDMETRQSAQSSQSGKDPIDSSVVNMEIDDTVVIDYPDEPECTLNEDELHQVLKVNSNKCIEHMRISPKEASRFDIPLCRMVYMPLDRPTLASDIKRLEADFAHGYHHGASVFYVTLCNECREERAVTDKDTKNWDPLWIEANNLFESQLRANKHLQHLQGRMFFICDGNHRFKAWMGYIDRLHREDKDWHIVVDSICLDTKGKTRLLLNTMHDINK
jgi:hypothetical protein